MAVQTPIYEDRIKSYFTRFPACNYYIYLDSFLEELGYTKPSRMRTRIINEHFPTQGGGVVPTIGSHHHRKLLTIDAVRYVFRTCSAPERQNIEPLMEILKKCKV